MEQVLQIKVARARWKIIGSLSNDVGKEKS